jgi:hypothetical protein
MKTIIEDLKNNVERLFEVKIGMAKNIEYLDDHKDFSEVTHLYQMNHEVFEVVNDIFFKLFPENQWGCQNIITAWRNLVNVEFYPLFNDALTNSCQSERLVEDFGRLRVLAEAATERYNNLMAG